MEGKRRRARGLSDSEGGSEEDDELKSWKYVLRKRKKVSVVINDEEEEEEEEEDDDEEDGDEEDGDKEDGGIDGMEAVKNGFLVVTCGSRKGSLDVKRLEKGEACIEHEGRLYAPPSFEALGGKAGAKKWKTSITFNGKPLQDLFDRRLLTTKGFRAAGTPKETKPPPGDTESSSEDQSSDIGEQTEEDDANDEPWSPRCRLDNEEEEEDLGKGEEDDGGAEESNRGGSTSPPEGDVQHKTVRLVLKKLSKDIRRHTCGLGLNVDQPDPPPVSEDGEENLKNDDDCSIELLEEDGECEPPSEPVQHAQDPRLQSVETHTDLTHHDLTHNGGSEVSSHHDLTHIGGSEVSSLSGSIKQEPKEELNEMLDYVPEELHLGVEEDGTSNVEKTEALSPSTKPTVTPEEPSPADGPSSTSPELLGVAPGPQVVTEMELLLPNVPQSGNVEEMSLDELKREAIKMQLKVLRLQEEYYNLKIKKVKE